MGRTLLVTGGAGYIGSHTCLELLEAGEDVVVVDNLSNSSAESLRRVQDLTGKELTFYRADLLDSLALDEIFRAHPFDAVIHFAGLKAVGESNDKPLAYFQNNVTGSLNLLQAMGRHDVRSLVFSSSATVYGDPATVPMDESAALRPTNPYGRTKLMVEEILQDLAASGPDWHLVALRYFNPVGAHPSGRIGEDPLGIPNNLMPYLMQVAVGKRDRLRIFGDDYPTRDGTGVRDYLHVVDLARGHLAAVDALGTVEGFRAFNLGTGTAYSVREVVDAVSRAVGRELPTEVVARRPGDVAEVCADPARAAGELRWTADLDLDAMCRDSWNWQQHNPEGYGSSQSAASPTRITPPSKTSA